MGLKYAPPMLKQVAFLPIAIMVFGGAFIISELLSNGGGGGGLLAFAIFFFAAGLWISYGFMFRAPYELVIQEGTLSWKAPVRSGSLPVSEIRSVRPYRWGQNAAMIKFDDGKGI